MLDPANLNSVFTSFRSGCFTNSSHKACLFGHCLAHTTFPRNYGFPETLTSKVMINPQISRIPIGTMSLSFSPQFPSADGPTIFAISQGVLLTGIHRGQVGWGALRHWIASSRDSGMLNYIYIIITHHRQIGLTPTTSRRKIQLKSMRLLCLVWVTLFCDIHHWCLLCRRKTPVWLYMDACGCGKLIKMLIMQRQDLAKNSNFIFLSR